MGQRNLPLYVLFTVIMINHLYPIIPSQLTDRHQITREKFIALNLDPLLFTLHVNRKRLLVHGTEFTNRLEALEDYGCFKDHQHNQSEKRIVPILVQAPQADTKDLEHKEWSNRMLFEEVDEGRHRNLEPLKTLPMNTNSIHDTFFIHLPVRAIYLSYIVDFGFGCQTLG